MDDLRLVRDAVRRFAEARGADGDRGAASSIAALPELALDALDPRSADHRILLAEALEALASHVASAAVLCLADLAARTLLDNPPDGRCALPIYADWPWLDPRLVVGADGVSGRVELVVGGSVHEWLVLPASHSEDGPATHVAVVPSSRATISPPLRTLGMRAAPTCDVTIAPQPCDLVPLDIDRLSLFRGPALAISAGIVASSSRAASDYAHERIQGGRPIIGHDEVRGMIGSMTAALAMCRAAARALCEDPRQPALFADARERAAAAAADGVQILGGNGYMEDYPQERHMRDARQACFLFGRAELLRRS